MEKSSMASSGFSSGGGSNGRTYVDPKETYITLLKGEVASLFVVKMKALEEFAVEISRLKTALNQANDRAIKYEEEIKRIAGNTQQYTPPSTISGQSNGL